MLFHKNKDQGSNKRLGHSFLKQILPTQGYRMHEDYVDILENGSVSTVALIYNDPGKAINLDSQWGILFIRNLVEDVIKNTQNDLESANTLSISFVNTVRRMSDDRWVRKHQVNTDRFSQKASENDNIINHRAESQYKMKQQDLAQIADELDQGAKYLAVGFKYVISALNVNQLDSFLTELQNRLKIRIPGTHIALSNGDIDYEFQRIFDDPMKEPGRKNMFTTAEFAGFYNLVTHGIEDLRGVYVGEQVGDINNTAVLWDMSNFDHHAVIAIDNRFMRLRDQRSGGLQAYRYQNYTGSDLWLNSLILQLVKEQQGRVFTLALDPFHMSPRLNSVTSQLNLNKGTINMFEMFGDANQEIEIYSANTNKIKMIAQQLAMNSIQMNNQDDRLVLKQTELDDLGQLLKAFYIDANMWVENPKKNLSDVRILNVDHKDVPMLHKFIAYLDTEYQRYSNPETGNVVKATEIENLKSVFDQLEATNSDLFDVPTSPIIDTLGSDRHTLFDYSGLANRQGNILLVQLLNSISAITNQTRDGDVIVIHGAQRITSLTEAYFNQILDNLFAKHVRVVFSYNNAKNMLLHTKFNNMASSDWTLTGHLTPDQIEEYNKTLGNQRQMTQTIEKMIQVKNEARYYLRRGQSNIVFDADQTI